MKIILPLIMLLIGAGAGVGAGVFLRPEPLPQHVVEEEVPESSASSSEKPEVSDGLSIDGKDYLKLSNQFVVPIVENDRVASMLVMTLSVEVPDGQEQAVYDIEPKVRDVFLRVLFDHAAVGAFDGAFLNNENLDAVRVSLRDAALQNFGPELISDVLIFEIARQDY